MKAFPVLIALCCLFFAGCAATSIDSKIKQYGKLAPQISLGDSKAKFLEVFAPLFNLPQMYQKPTDQYMQDGKTVAIYYIRSNRISDYLTTDDEFTPYIFTDSVLTGIGWAVLGGPKSRGQSPTATGVNINNSTTVIH